MSAAPGHNKIASRRGQASPSEIEKHYQEIPQELAPDTGENDLQKNNMHFSEKKEKLERKYRIRMKYTMLYQSNMLYQHNVV